MTLNIVDRILAKVAHDTKGCWNFLGALDRYGYGLIMCRKFQGRSYAEKAHRVMFMAFKGDIPRELVVRHRCDNPRCCNPEHLELGTQKENIWDQMHKGRHVSQQRRAAMEAPF